MLKSHARSYYPWWQQLLPGPTPPSLLPGQGGHYIEIFWVLHQLQVEGLNLDVDTVLGEGEELSLTAYIRA